MCGRQTREGKLFVLIGGGEEIPVSRPYRAAAKARFGSLPEA